MAGFVRRIRLTKPLQAVHLAVDADGAHETSSSSPSAQPVSSPLGQELLAQQAAAAVAAARQAEAQLLETAAVKEWLVTLDERLVELEQRRSQSLNELQEVAVLLAVEVASQILKRAISQDEFPVVEMVQQSIDRLEAARALVVRLHPLDLRHLQTVLSRTDAGWQLPGHVRLVADTSLSRGDCLADGGDFGLLSTFEQQLADLRQGLQESIQDAQTERRADAAADQGMRRFPNRRETA